MTEERRTNDKRIRALEQETFKARTMAESSIQSMSALGSDIKQLASDVSKVSGIIEEGFKRTHERLDKLNGKVAEHEKWKNEHSIEHDSHFEKIELILDTMKRESDDKKEESSYWKRFFTEKIIWILLLLASWVLFATGIINPPQ